MQQEESCSSLLSEQGRSRGGCACSDLKPSGSSRIPGHSVRLVAVTQKSALLLPEQEAQALAPRGWTSGSAGNGAALLRKAPREFQLLHSLARPLFNVFSATVFLVLGTMQNLISTSMTSCISQNLSGGNPNTTIHKMAMKSLSPSLENNTRAVFGPGVLIFLTCKALSISEIVRGTSLYRDIPELHWIQIWTDTHHF